MKHLSAALLLAPTLASPLSAQSAAMPRPSTPKPLRDPDVIYVPTLFAVVDAVSDLTERSAWRGGT